MLPKVEKFIIRRDSNYVCVRHMWNSKNFVPIESFKHPSTVQSLLWWFTLLYENFIIRQVQTEMMVLCIRECSPCLQARFHQALSRFLRFSTTKKIRWATSACLGNHCNAVVQRTFLWNMFGISIAHLRHILYLVYLG